MTEKTGPVVVRLSGGLGNQMFQYACGRRLSLARAAPLVLDTSSYLTYKTHAFGLDAFNIAGSVTRAGADGLRMRLRDRLLPRRFRIEPAYRPGHWVFERQLRFNPRIIDLTCPVGLDGYWQSETYFVDVADTIREDLTLRRPVQPKTSEFLDLARTDEMVALHIRRGDYVANASAARVHGTCTLEYYAAALDLVAKKVPGATLAVFSDDQDWAKRNLPGNLPRVFVDWNQGRPAEDLRCIAACQHFIIANSTFSWWGAWLGEAEHSLVIAPKTWFVSRHDARDLLPARWTRV